MTSSPQVANRSGPLGHGRRIGAFAGEECVGYSSNLVVSHLHERHKVVCYNDIIYVANGWRTQALGRRLILRTEGEAAGLFGSLRYAG